jgi:hypothetical protein
MARFPKPHRPGHTGESGEEPESLQSFLLDGVFAAAKNLIIAIGVIVVALLVIGVWAEGDSSTSELAHLEDRPLSPSGAGPKNREQSVTEMAPARQSDDAIPAYYPELAGLCSDQETIDNMVGPFKSAIGQLVLGSAPDAAAMSLDEAFIRVNVLGEQLSRARYRFLNIRSLGREESEDGTITVRCRANLRVVEPIKGSDGAFSSYVQFNNARYSVRFRNAGSDDQTVHVLAEIQPVDGKWDIVTGTE